MEKRVLIAVDGSLPAERAVDYVGLMEGALIRDLKVTLFHVMNPVPPYLRHEGQSDPLLFKQLRALETKNREAAVRVLERAREHLLRHGLAEDRVEVKAHPRTSDSARDILFETEQGLYDAVVLGRRGLSKTQELFLGSVTNKVVQHAERTPVWVVGGRVTSHKVLCAVDGSEGSLKAVDHLAFMLGGNPECKVDLLHVGAIFADYCPVDFTRPDKEGPTAVLDSGPEPCTPDFYRQALRLLKEGGLEEDQIEVLERPGRPGVVGAILEEVRAGGYGTVVLGRRGEGGSSFLGHVSDRVLNKGGEVAVWIVG